MAESEDPRDSKSPFGVLEFFAWGHEWNGFYYSDFARVEQAADLMQEAGVGFVRMDFLAVVGHFKASVKYWEIWNEPDSPAHWQPQDGLKKYSQLLKKGVQKVMAKNNDSDKPLWITEIGCPGVQNPAVKNWWAGQNPTEEEQARWVDQIYTNPGRFPGVQKIFWAFFRDTRGHFKGGVDYFGLVSSNFSKKKSYEGYKRAANAPIKRSRV